MGRILRALAWLAAVLLLVLSVAQVRSFRETRNELAETWAEATAGRPTPRASTVVEREPDLLAARLAIARAALAESLDARWLSDLPPEEAAPAADRLAERLEHARADAAAVYAQRPAAWEAPLVLGGATFLQRWRERDLHLRREEWELPLLQARALAPAHREPTGLLAAAKLAIWHTLPETERAETRGFLREAMEDETVLRRVLPLWAGVASDREELVSVLPPSPLPWQLLEDHYARLQDWEESCAARDRWRPLHLAQLSADLAEAERRLQGGDVMGGRQLLLRVAATAPPSRQAAPLLSQAVQRLPPGVVGPSHRQGLRGWLDWALPLWLAEQPSLSPETFRRLEGAVTELPTHLMALAALAGGELARAELMERRTERQWSREWAPYLIAKARFLIGRGDIEDAAAALGQVHRSAHDRWAFRRLAATVGDRLERPDSRIGLEATSWHGMEWQRWGGQHHLEIVPGHPAEALSLVFFEVSPQGAAVELSWNGVIQGCYPVESDRAVRLAVDVESAPGLLQLRKVAGGTFAPGPVELEGDARVASRPAGEP